MSRTKIIWLDDDIESIEYEAYILLPKKLTNIEIKTFDRIAELVDYVNENNLKNNKNVI